KSLDLKGGGKSLDWQGGSVRTGRGGKSLDWKGGKASGLEGGVEVSGRQEGGRSARKAGRG
ncbi:unnamed protein product, partial [Staurois parvus]